MKLASHLWQSRHGIFYLRIVRNGREMKRSLGTRDPRAAQLLAYRFGAKIHAMSTPDDSKELPYWPPEFNAYDDLDEKLDKVVQYALERKLDGDSESAVIKSAWLGARLYGLPPELLPKAIAQALAKRRFSMLEQDANEAAILAAADAEFQKLLNADPRLKSHDSQPPAAAPAITQAPAAAASPAAGTWTLKQCVDDYMQESEQRWSDGTARTYKSSFKKLLDGLGSTTPIHTINVDRFVKWRLTLDQKQHPDTVTRDCGAWRGLFDWASSRERFAGKNPIENAKFSDGQRARLDRERGIDREPFAAEDLKKIFAVTAKKPCAHWLPRMALYTGARLGELGELKHTHIKEFAPGRWSMLIDDGKTEASRREIPLHPALIEAGFIEYLADAKRIWPDSDFIFPHLKPAGKNGRANLPGRDFGKLKTALGMDETKVFHSFRKTLISCLQYNGCIAEHRRPFVGHEDLGDNKRPDTHEEDYSKARFDPARMAEIIFPHLNFKDWPKWEPEIGRYQPGRFDEFFIAIKRSQTVRAARDERAERTGKTRKKK